MIALCLIIRTWILFMKSGWWRLPLCHSEYVWWMFLTSLFFVQVNAVKFNEYSSVVVSAGYDRSLRTWDCRSHSTEPIQVLSFFILCTERVLCTWIYTSFVLFNQFLFSISLKETSFSITDNWQLSRQCNVGVSYKNRNNWWKCGWHSQNIWHPTWEVWYFGQIVFSVTLK